MPVTVPAAHPRLGIRGEASTISVPGSLDAGHESGDDGLDPEDSLGGTVETAPNEAEADHHGVAQMGGEVVGDGDVDVLPTAEVTDRVVLPAHTAPIRPTDESVDAAWNAAATRAADAAALAGLGDGRPDFGAQTWGGEGVAVKAPGAGRGLAPLATSKPKLSAPRQLSWPWVEAGEATEPLPPVARRRVNALKPLGGAEGVGAVGARRERMRTAMDGRMETLQRRLLVELEQRRLDVDALAKAPLGSVNAKPELVTAWATGGAVGGDAANGETKSQTRGVPEPPSAFGTGPGPAPARIRKLKEAQAQSAAPGESELAWIRRLVHFVDTSPIFVPQEGASATAFTEDRQWEQTVFPSARPKRREDVLLLERWLEAMLADLSIEMPRVPGHGTDAGATEELGEAALWVYRVAFEELRRQVELQCRDRASLLARVWDHFFLLVELRNGLRYEEQLAEIHADRHALKLAMDQKDAECLRLNEELDVIEDRHRDELLAAERSRASLARQMVEVERKAKEEHVRALEANKKLLEEIGVRLNREDTIGRLRKEAEDLEQTIQSTEKEMRDEKAAKERSIAAHDDTSRDLEEARATIDKLRATIDEHVESKLQLQRSLAERTAQLDSERIAVANIDASMRAAQQDMLKAKNAQLAAEAERDQKERERAKFEAVHSGLEQDLLDVRKAKGKIDVMYQKLSAEHAGAMERMLKLEDTLEKERAAALAAAEAASSTAEKAGEEKAALEKRLKETQDNLEGQQKRSAALAKEIESVRSIMKDLAANVRSTAELKKGILPDDIPIGVVDPENVTGLPDSAKTDIGKGKELMKKVLARMKEAKRELDELVRAREVSRLAYEDQEELRIKAERDVYQEKLRNEMQAKEMKAAEQATAAAVKEKKRLEDLMKTKEKTVSELREKLSKEETKVQEMKVKYADYEERKKKLDKTTNELDTTRKELAEWKEKNRKLEGNVDALKAEVKRLEELVAQNEKKIKDQQRQIEELNESRAKIQKTLDAERIANEENVAGRAAEAALKKRHERDLASLQKEKEAVEVDRDALREQLTRMFKRVAIARLCMQGLGNDLPDDAPPVREVEPNTYDAMQFIKQDEHKHTIPVNMLKLKIAMLSRQCKKLRTQLTAAAVVRLKAEETILERARAREEEMVAAFAELVEGERVATAEARDVLAEMNTERLAMVEELAEMGAIRAAEDPRLYTYDRKFKTRKDGASQCNDALMQVWTERAQRLPQLSGDSVLDKRLVLRVVVETYYKRSEHVAIELEKLRAGVGVVSAGERFGGGALQHDTVFDSVMRAALEEGLAPLLKIEGTTLEDSINNFLASARHYAADDAKCKLFCRFTAMCSTADHLNTPAFHAFAGFVDCVKRLMGVNWAMAHQEWTAEKTAIPHAVVLDFVANVYNTNTPDKVPLYAEVLLPAMVSDRNGLGLDLDVMLDALMSDYSKGLAPISAMEKPRRLDQAASRVGTRGGTASSVDPAKAAKRAAAADKWSATLGALRAPSEKSATLAKGVS